MKATDLLAMFSLSVVLSACGGVQAGGNVQSGVQAMLAGNNQTALSYFQAAAQQDPTYIYNAQLQLGVMSYLGRAQYLTGNYPQARQTLERNLSQHRTDNFARLYLGLTLYRLGDQKAALANIQRGMNGIYNWLNYLDENFRFEFGQGWDPGGTIRAGIKTDLDMISSDEIDWPRQIAE